MNAKTMASGAVIAALIGSIAAGAAQAPARPASGACEALVGSKAFAQTEITRAVQQAAEAGRPAFCEVQGVIRPVPGSEIGVVYRLPQDWKDQFARRYREAFAAELVPVDGVLEALGQITTPTCVASSGSHDKLRFTLGHTGLYERFEGRIFSGYEVANGKPAPDLFLHAAARMGADPVGCVVVEDSRWGVEAARAVGMRAFGYAGGLTPPEYLEGHGTVVFEDMRELPRLLADGAA